MLSTCIAAHTPQKQCLGGPCMSLQVAARPCAVQTVPSPAACQLRSPATCRHSAHSPLTDCTGDQRSEAVSYPCGSSPGLWRMEMHTRPSLYTAQQPQQPQSVHLSLQEAMPLTRLPLLRGNRAQLGGTLTVWVPHVRGESAGWRRLWVVCGECEQCIEEAPLAAEPECGIVSSWRNDTAQGHCPPGLWVNQDRVMQMPTRAMSDSLERVWRAHYGHLPLKQVDVVHQPC